MGMRAAGDDRERRARDRLVHLLRHFHGIQRIGKPNEDERRHLDLLQRGRGIGALRERCSAAYGGLLARLLMIDVR
jgi:hypothetical protein